MTTARLQAFLRTLDQLPASPGVSMRGCADTAEFVRLGQSVVTTEITATTRRLDAATENGTTPALYVVVGRSGRDLSAFSARSDLLEIAFAPGTFFHLAGTEEVAGRTVHLVYELDPLDPRIDDAAPRRMFAGLAGVLTDLDRHDHAPVDVPEGRFAGDIR